MIDAQEGQFPKLCCRCRGTGLVGVGPWSDECPRCDGTGYVPFLSEANPEEERVTGDSGAGRGPGAPHPRRPLRLGKETKR